MKRQTSAQLTRLDDCEWFRNVGDPVSDETVVVVASWKEAIRHCRTEDWEYLQQETANLLGLRIGGRSDERLQEWNDIVDEVKAVSMALVSRKIQAVVRENRLPKVFEDVVQWDVLHACMECEYADIISLDFYANQAYWYEQGHFPCGWEGIYPEGKLIIY